MKVFILCSGKFDPETFLKGIVPADCALPVNGLVFPRRSQPKRSILHDSPFRRSVFSPLLQTPKEPRFL